VGGLMDMGIRVAVFGFCGGSIILRVILFKLVCFNYLFVENQYKY
jgi:hypothetical protein